MSTDIVGKPFEECPICSECFLYHHLYVKHMVVHSREEQETTFYCSFCDDAFASKSDLDAHKENHPGHPKYPFVCSLCEGSGMVAFSHRRYLNKHMLIHNTKHSFVCNLCSLEFDEENAFNEHVQSHSVEEPHDGLVYNEDPNKSIDSETNPFKCSECNTRFQSEELCDKHVLTHTTNTRIIYTCYACERVYGNEKVYRKHMKTHNGRYVCPVCSKVYTTSQILKQHMFSHSEKRAFKCEVCGKNFKRQAYLYLHMSIHNGKKVFKCVHPECNKRFSKLRELSRHRLSHTAEKGMVVSEDGIPSFNCTFCDGSFTTKLKCQRHMSSHTGERPFVCTICKEAFTNKKNLLRHMFIHSDKKRFLCDLCNLGFVRKCDLEAHMTYHKGGKAFICAVCDTSFARKSILVEHLVNHSSEYPYKCTICDAKKFRKKKLFEWHMINHHPEGLNTTVSQD